MILRTSILSFVAAVAIWAVTVGSGEETGASVGGPPPGLALEPSFVEDFDGTTVDFARWSPALYEPDRETPTVTKRNLWNNRERQIYFDRNFLGLGINPFRLAGGTLAITANPLSDAATAAVRAAVRREPATISDSSLRDVAYSSGLISTRGRFSQTYGYFEIRARWPAGKGLWPAFWLLPANGRWPPEIDVMEAHGDKPGVIFQSVHAVPKIDVTKRASVSGDPRAFHVYGVLWTPTTIDYYIDTVKTNTQPTPPGMDRPMYLIANMAIGGKWPGDPDGSTTFPATMDIDYIHAWKFKTLPR